MTQKNLHTDIITALKQANSDNTTSIYVPSQDKHIDFYPITVRDQKKIVTTSLESSVNTSAFHVTTNRMIENCCSDKQMEFSVIDRAAILISLRVNMLGSTVVVVDSKGKEHDLDISQHVQSFGTHKLPEKHLESKKLTVGDIDVMFEPAPLKNDTIVSRVSQSILDNLLQKSSISDSIREAIVYEFVKFIQYIEISGKRVDFEPKNAEQLVKIVEALPMSMSQLLFKEIDRVKKPESRYTSVDTEEFGKCDILVNPGLFNTTT